MSILTRDDIRRKIETHRASARSYVRSDAAGGDRAEPVRAETIVTGGIASDGIVTDVVVTLRPAAVLVALVERPEGLTLLLTLRASHLKAHAGQISFPGGGIDSDSESAENAALREAREEIGLARDRVEILGRLDDYLTTSKFTVVPVVAMLNPPFELKPDPAEVADVFEVPLDFILDRKNWKRESRIAPDGTQRRFYAMPYEGRYIWGATAAMIVNLADVLDGPP